MCNSTLEFSKYELNAKLLRGIIIRKNYTRSNLISDLHFMRCSSQLNVLPPGVNHARRKNNVDIFCNRPFMLCRLLSERHIIFPCLSLLLRHFIRLFYEKQASESHQDHNLICIMPNIRNMKIFFKLPSPLLLTDCHLQHAAYTSRFYTT